MGLGGTNRATIATPSPSGRASCAILIRLVRRKLAASHSCFLFLPSLLPMDFPVPFCLGGWCTTCDGPLFQCRCVGLHYPWLTWIHTHTHSELAIPGYASAQMLHAVSLDSCGTVRGTAGRCLQVQQLAVPVRVIKQILHHHFLACVGVVASAGW